MSLLMDALKKAELAKRQGQAEVTGGSTGAEAQAGLALEPLTVPGATESAAANAAPEHASAAENLPDLPAHLEELEAQFLADAKKAAAARLKAPSSTAPMRDPQVDQPAAADAAALSTATVKARPASPEQSGLRQAAAQNLFAAKQADKPPARKTLAIAIGVFTVLSVCAVGGYFWWQLQPKSILVANRTPLSPPPAPTVAGPSVAPVNAAPGSPQSAVPAPKDKAEDAAPVATSAPAQPRRAAPPATEADSSLRVTRAPLTVNPALIRGFDAFNRGDLALAQTEYERAQKSDPRNTDALHGLAAIAVRQGRPEQAEWLYRQIVEADPQDAVAMAALINSRGQIDPGAAESRLKSLSAAQPELAAPHFALGNLYARHGRWNDAQQAYFRAHSAEPDNPDILYNLAISLEHLRQNKLAAQYYSQAIAAAQDRPVGFDQAQAAARLQTLQH